MSQPRQSLAPRFEGIDAVRLVAAFSVVWIHAVAMSKLEPLSALGRFAVPFFVLSAVFFGLESLRRDPTRRFGPYLRARFGRIYWPFIVWCALYLLVWKALAMADLGPLPIPESRRYWLWVGTTYHLWFLPFIFVVGLALFPVSKLLTHLLARRASLSLITIGVAAALGWAVALAQPAASSRPPVFWLWQYPLEALPAAFWGIAFYAAWHGGARNWLQTRGAAPLALILWLGASLALWGTGHNALLANLAGLGAFAFGLVPAQNRAVVLLSRGGGLAFGIYLSHVAFVIAAQALLLRFKIEPNPFLTIAVWLLAALASLVFTAIVKSSRLNRVLLPG